MKGVLLLAMAFVRHNLWVVIMLLLWPWLFGGALLVAGQTPISDYVDTLRQESFYGLIIIGFMATAALNNEQKSRRVIAVLSKAVSRGEYLTSFLVGVFLVGICFTLSTALATWWATFRVPISLLHLPVFMISVLTSALWIAALSLMFSTFLPPFLTTICTALGVGSTLFGLHSSNPAWTILAPIATIFAALASNPFSAAWSMSWLPLASATIQIFIFLAIGARAFQYRDLTRAIE